MKKQAGAKEDLQGEAAAQANTEVNDENPYIKQTLANIENSRSSAA